MLRAHVVAMNGLGVSRCGSWRLWGSFLPNKRGCQCLRSGTFLSSPGLSRQWEEPWRREKLGSLV